MSHCRHFALSTGYLMRVPSDEIRKQVCDTVITFYCEGPSKQVQRKFSFSTSCISHVHYKSMSQIICLYLWLVIHNEYLCTRYPTGHQPNTLQYNKRIVEKSDVAETLVKSLTLLENDISVKIAVLNVLQHLSKDSCKTHGIRF